MHTPFDAVDDGFDNGSSAFLREEADEIYFMSMKKFAMRTAGVEEDFHGAVG